jgi:hypothetical protein
MVYGVFMPRSRTNIYLDEAQLDALRERGLPGRRSIADQVREAVDEHLGRATRAVVTAPGRLPASDYPSSAADWTRRPYFLHEAQITWADFVGLLHSADDERRRWALTRLLDGARWQDIWRLVTPDAVRVDLPHLHFRGRWFWEGLLDDAA